MLLDENKCYKTEDKSLNQQLQSTLSSLMAQLKAALSLLENQDEFIFILNQELEMERDRNTNSTLKNYFVQTSKQYVDDSTETPLLETIKRRALVIEKSILKISFSMRCSFTSSLFIMPIFNDIIELF